MTKPTHGGPRPGAGRKPTDTPNKITTSLRVSPQVKEFLATLNASEHVEAMVRRSKAFKTWLAAHRHDSAD